MRIFSSVLLFSIVAPIANTLPTAANAGLVPHSIAIQHGLTRRWHTQVSVDNRRGRVAHVTHHVSTKRFFHIHTITYKRETYVVSDRDLDNNGIPIGSKTAADMADERVRQLKRLRRPPTHDVQKLPETTLFIQTNQGVVQAIDAQTGRTLWISDVGKRNYLTMAPAASDTCVAALNGSTLYILDRGSGTIKWSRSLVGAPGAGAAISNEMVFVPMANGTIEGYQVADSGLPTWIFKSAGRSLIPPTITDTTVSWPTSHGHLYVGSSFEGQIRYRFEADSIIAAPSTHIGTDRLYFASLDGDVFALDQPSGEIAWRFSVGDEVSLSPVPIGDGIYVISENNHLYRLDVKDGQPQWRSGRIKQFLAAGKDRLYCRDTLDNVVLLDTETGVRIGSFNVPGVDYFLTNLYTDRIFLGTRTGMLQCLHPSETELPMVHLVIAKKKSQKPAEDPSEEETKVDGPVAEPGNEPTEETENPFDNDDDNPFAFGESDTPTNANEEMSPPADETEDESENPFAEDEENESNPFEA